MKKLMQMATLVFSRLVLVVAASVHAHPEETSDYSGIRIVGGDELSPFSRPYMASLRVLGEIHFCGGTFIGGKYVLTAAHCVEAVEDHADSVSVWLGGHKLSEPDTGRIYQVARFYTHPDYDNETIDNDIAIVELQQDVEGIEPVPLISAEQFADIDTGSVFETMGWGTLGYKKGQPDTLQVVKVPNVDRELCNSRYDGAITKNMLCAGFDEGGKDSCQGDSGGPLIYNHQGTWYQLGVVSWGFGCAEPGYPGVYTNIFELLDWLRQTAPGI
ncbi:serine protease [Endozoicomonas sp. SCSIO W0465]|uniref:serine protease n=1 Tax=Endozoicomonas sp. SCSIO W0465 TaxID=2918516 RepID=UPI0020753684|nr:serine protease [Endozoicomonas sp. SCSIO W0465]USE37317.1 serine protease [Endozoicomonas sp. SCSIO W0465]